MKDLEVLRLDISAPSAHFRIINSNDPRRTYPVPPYSTIIGLLANILGDAELIDRFLNSSFYLGMAAQYEFLSRDYTWLRNMEKGAHQNRFASVANRRWQENIEHAGGQSPVVFEVLNHYELKVYLCHPDKTIVQQLTQNIFLADKWFSHLHLGRAEDWAMVESAAPVTLTMLTCSKDIQNAAQYYQWMPTKDHIFNGSEHFNLNDYTETYSKTQGTVTLVTTIYSLMEAPGTNSQMVTIRNFDHIPAKLVKGQVPLLDNFKLPALLVDFDLCIPVYLAKMNGRRPDGGEGIMLLAKSNGTLLHTHIHDVLQTVMAIKASSSNSYPAEWWTGLSYAAVLHDLGKIDPDFQRRMIQFLYSGNDIPHGFLSLVFYRLR